MQPQPHSRAGLLLGLVATLSMGAPVAAEPLLIDDRGNATVQLEDLPGLTEGTRVEVRGLDGTLSLRQGPPGTLRYWARGVENRRDPYPLDLVQDGEHLRLEPGDRTPDGPGIFELVLPPELALDVEIGPNKVDLTGLGGPVVLRGDGSSVVAADLTGPVRIELTGGSLQLDRAVGGVELTGDGLEARLTDLAGTVRLQLDGGQASIEGHNGRLSAELRDAPLRVSGLTGEAQVRGRGGNVRFTDLSGGAAFRLAGTALFLDGVDADVLIDSDASVQFGNARGRLEIEADGGKIRGSGSEAALAIRAEGSKIELASLSGALVLEGDGLDVQILDSSGDLTLELSDSQVEVFGSKGPLRLSTLGGDVRVNQQRGPLEIRASGPVVSVGWASVPDADSVVENGAGDVMLLFPPSANCSIEARSLNGRIESSLDGVEVSEDGTRASGSVGSGGTSRVDVSAGGDVKLRGRRSSR